MKQIISIILLVVSFVLTAKGENIVSLSTVEGAPGETVNVTLSLANSDEVTAVDVTIKLDAQLSYIDESCILNDERSNGHTLTAGINKDGDLRIIIVNLDLAPLQGDDGILATFQLKLRRQPAVYVLQPTVLLVGNDGTALSAKTIAGAVTIRAPRLTVVTPSIDYGHIPIRNKYTRNITLRNDGTSALTVSAINFSAEEFSVTESNLTIAAGGTKNITVNYEPVKYGAIEESITIHSDAINGTQTATIVADPYSVNELHVGNGSGISGDEVEITLTMNNMEPIVAAQWSFKMPKELVYVDGSLTPASRAMIHKPMTSIKGDTLTMILYNENNECIADENGALATFKVRPNGKSGTYYLRPIDVVLGNIILDNMTSATSNGYVSVKSPKLSSNTTLNMGNVPVTETATQQYSVHNSGSATLKIDRINFLSEGWKTTTTLPIIIEAGKSSSIDIEYTPTKAGQYTTTMNVYTNDPETRMKTVNVNTVVYEPNNIDIKGRPTINGYAIDVILNNYSTLAGVQMDIHWIEGMKSENSLIELTDRMNGMSSIVSEIGENTYRVIIYSLDNTQISGNEGEIFRLLFTTDKDIDFVGSTITIDNIVMGSITGANISSQNTVKHSAIHLPGDANGDGLYTISDIVLTANSVLNGTTTGIVKINADTSKDGELSVIDIVGVANAVLSAQ